MESNLVGARILIVEDDATIALGLVAALEHERFDAHHVDSGEKALVAIREKTPDLVICDIMLPGVDGLQVMRTVRSEFPLVPVMMLTAKSEEIDKVLGLEMGATDYVTKPFSVREVVALVKRRLRDRSATESRTPDMFHFGNVKVDLRRRILWKNGEETTLTTHEAGTLQYLITHRGRDVPRDELLQEVWRYTPGVHTRTVDNAILKLRKKIEDTPGRPRHILTVHNTGYRFEP